MVHGMKITMDRSAAYTLYLWRFLPENICATHFWLKITSVSAEIRGHSWLNRYYNQLNNPPLFEAFWGIQSFISCRPLNCASTVRKVWLFQYFLVKIYTIVSSSIYHYTNAITILGSTIALNLFCRKKKKMRSLRVKERQLMRFSI